MIYTYWGIGKHAYKGGFSLLYANMFLEYLCLLLSKKIYIKLEGIIKIIIPACHCGKNSFLEILMHSISSFPTKWYGYAYPNSRYLKHGLAGCRDDRSVCTYMFSYFLASSPFYNSFSLLAWMFSS